MRHCLLLLPVIASIALAESTPPPIVESSSAESNTTKSSNKEQNVQEQIIELNKITAIARGFDVKLDELNRNVYVIDKSFIEEKGFKTTEEVFNYIPFVTRNSVGLGTNIDLRAQGSSSNVNVQVLLNGVNLNMLDSSHGVTPINTIAPSDIERIEVLPGGGAVSYGNGTRGGVINIITKRRYEKFSPSVGVSYTGTPNSRIFGSEVNVDAKIGGKIGQNLYYGLSGRYLYKYGYRIGDEQNAFNVGGNLTYDINENHSIFVDVSYFRGIINTSPNLLFSLTGGALSYDNAPLQRRQYNQGEGIIKTQQDRIDASIGYEAHLTPQQKLTIKAFYHYNNLLYLTNLQDVWYRVGNNTTLVQDFDQSGSRFGDSKAGGSIRYDLKHTNGLFVAGFDTTWQKGERLLDMYYSSFPVLYHNLLSGLDADKYTNSLYLIEKYNFTNHFSLTAGARYENAHYSGARTYSHEMLMLSPPSFQIPTLTTGTRFQNINRNISNFALELTPKYDFGSGSAFVKYERGYRSPNPDNLTRVAGLGAEYQNNDVASEYYHTFEIGSQANLGEHIFLSGAVFYTLTENELYSYGSAHSGFGGYGYGNFGLTQRVGLELFSEQSFFAKTLRFSESFTYVDARILSGSRNGVSLDGQLIPFVSNYKATIGINWDISKHFGIWTQNSFVGEQRDWANVKINPYILTDLGIDMRLKNLNLTLGVRNLFNSLYFLYYNSDSSDLTLMSYLYAPGRQIFADLRYAF